MLNLTPIAKIVLKRRAKQARAAAADAERTQRGLLQWLLRKGADTEWGKTHNYHAIKSYEDFCRCVPVGSYEDFRPSVMRMVEGEANILWPGVTRRFAQSSGTSGGKSKYIPVTTDSLRRNHYPGASESVAFYLENYPDSRMFSGRGFILGGSFATELDTPRGVLVGDLSAHLIDSISPIANIYRVPRKEVALMRDWRDKLPALVSSAAKENITNLSGVPSWFLTVLKETMAANGAQSVFDIWPRLEVFFYGGVSFAPYRSEYKRIAGDRLRYWQTYNASEGFFACQDITDTSSMLLLQNAGIFYEFVPLDQIGKPFPDALPSWKVKKGNTYSLIITSCNGLWRYAVGDTVKVESLNPLRISVAGRTNSFINVFGEEVMVYNTDAALTRACDIMGCAPANYTAAPVYTEGDAKGHHQWMIEWNHEPEDMAAFERTLDQCLCNENSDYQAKRQGDIFLAPLEVTNAKPGLFDAWLSTTGRLGGQRKVPRLSNDRKIMDQLLKINTTL